MSNIDIYKNSLQTANNIISDSSTMMKLERKLTINDTFGKPLMRSIFKGKTGQVGFSVVQTIVKRFILSFGFSTPPTPIVIEMITIDTLENFGYETLEDVVIFFKMARSGKFGSAKKGIDSNLLFGEWFPKYLELKADKREQIYEEEKNKRNSKNITSEDVKKTYEVHLNRNRHSKAKTFIDNMTSQFNRNMLEECIKLWSSQPDKKPYLNYLKSKRKIIKE